MLKLYQINGCKSYTLHSKVVYICNTVKPRGRNQRSSWQVRNIILTLKVLVATIDAVWEGMGDVGSARYEPALLPPCPTIGV